MEGAGWIRGKVLDSGGGTGEHTIHLTALGYDVHGIDSSPQAIEQARALAAARDVAARVRRRRRARVEHRPQLRHDPRQRTIPHFRP
ncbi:MAG: class I SAM-dependent methyltransferase [Sciscionella sp.]